MNPTSELSPATSAGTLIDPAAPGSAAETFGRHPDHRHPGEVVLGALLRARTVKLPDGRRYRLGEDLSLGTVGIGPDDGSGFVLTSSLTFGQFLDLSEALSRDEMRDIALGNACNVERRPAGAPAKAGHAADDGCEFSPATSAGTIINPAETGSAAAMFDVHPARKHPGEVVLGALLRARAVDLPDGRCYRLGEDLSLGTVGIGPDDESGFVLTSGMSVGDFLRLSSGLSFNEMYDIARGKACSVEQRRARARLARGAAPAAG